MYGHDTHDFKFGHFTSVKCIIRIEQRTCIASRIPCFSSLNMQISNVFITLKPRLHEQFLCGNCIWQFLFARVDDRQIFVFKLRQAMLDGQNLGTLGTGFYRCR